MVRGNKAFPWKHVESQRAHGGVLQTENDDLFIEGMWQDSMLNAMAFGNNICIK